MGGRKDILIPVTYLEIIDYFIKHRNEKQHCQEIGKYLYPEKPCQPKEPGSTYTSINKKCHELEKMRILEREYLETGKKGSFAWFYQLKNDMNF